MSLRATRRQAGGGLAERRPRRWPPGRGRSTSGRAPARGWASRSTSATSGENAGSEPITIASKLPEPQRAQEPAGSIHALLASRRDRDGPGPRADGTRARMLTPFHASAPGKRARGSLPRTVAGQRGHVPATPPLLDGEVAEHARADDVVRVKEVVADQEPRHVSRAATRRYGSRRRSHRARPARATSLSVGRTGCVTVGCGRLNP